MPKKGAFMPIVNVKKLHENATLPTYGSEFSAGADLYAVEACEIAPGETKLVHTGLAMEIPSDTRGLSTRGAGLRLSEDLRLRTR